MSGSSEPAPLAHGGPPASEGGWWRDLERLLRYEITLRIPGCFSAGVSAPEQTITVFRGPHVREEEWAYVPAGPEVPVAPGAFEEVPDE